MRESAGTSHRGRWARTRARACARLRSSRSTAPRRPPIPAKTLRVAFSIAESSFDPQFASDAPSDSIIDNIFDTMLTYDYLARPVKLVPRALETMPEVSDGGSTYTFRFRKGIFFTPDPAFGGKPRELVAADQAYAIRRLLDPAVKSPWLWLVEGKIVGADAVRERASKSGKFDYDAPIAGLEVVDRYTLRIRLTQPDLRFLYVFAVPNTAPVAREVVAAYGVDIGAHPVGTGPYMLGEYKRSSKIVLVANPGYRETTYAPAGPIPADAAGSRGGAQGQKAADSGTHRGVGDRGGAGDVARVRQPRARPPRAACRPNSSIRRSRAAS